MDDYWKNFIWLAPELYVEREIYCDKCGGLISGKPLDLKVFCTCYKHNYNAGKAIQQTDGSSEKSDYSD